MLKNNNLSNNARENLSRFLLDLSIGPYENSQKSLEELIVLSNTLKNERFTVFKALKFKNLLEKNKLTIKLLMEG